MNYCDHDHRVCVISGAIYPEFHGFFILSLDCGLSSDREEYVVASGYYVIFTFLLFSRVFLSSKLFSWKIQAWSFQIYDYFLPCSYCWKMGLLLWLFLTSHIVVLYILKSSLGMDFVTCTTLRRALLRTLTTSNIFSLEHLKIFWISVVCGLHLHLWLFLVGKEAGEVPCTCCRHNFCRNIMAT